MNEHYIERNFKGPYRVGSGSFTSKRWLHLLGKKILTTLTWDGKN
jgi:hypothetical protein